VHVSARALAGDADRLRAELRERRERLERSADAYLALADRLDDEIAALEVAQRLAVPADDVDLDELIDRAERHASKR